MSTGVLLLEELAHSKIEETGGRRSHHQDEVATEFTAAHDWRTIGYDFGENNAAAPVNNEEVATGTADGDGTVLKPFTDHRRNGKRTVYRHLICAQGCDNEALIKAYCSNRLLIKRRHGNVVYLGTMKLQESGAAEVLYIPDFNAVTVASRRLTRDDDKLRSEAKSVSAGQRLLENKRGTCNRTSGDSWLGKVLITPSGTRQLAITNAYVVLKLSNLGDHIFVSESKLRVLGAQRLKTTVVKRYTTIPEKRADARWIALFAAGRTK